MTARTVALTLLAGRGLLPAAAAAEPRLPALPPPAATRVDFTRDIKPLLEQSCLHCHGAVKPKSGHRVDTREAILKGGESHEAAILPGQSGKSPLVHYIAGLVPDMEMPPLDNREKYPALTAGEIALVRAWIDQGASWPEGVSLAEVRPTARQTGPVVEAGAKAPSPIFAHIRQGNVSAIATALADRSQLESRDASGNTPLIQAAFYLDAAQVETFLEHGADPNAANRAGATALMRATADVHKVRALLKRGAKADARSASGHTALIIACREHGAADVVRELLAQGADVHAAIPAGVNALMAAVETGDEEVVRLLLVQGANPNSAVRLPYSPAVESALMMAAHYGHAGCVKLLLEHGADPRFASDYGNALHFAAMTNRVEVARLLIDRGVDVNVPGRRIASFRNDFGLTPLMYAAGTERNDPTLVQLLLDAGAKVDAKTAAGETALTLARQRGETKVVATLRAAGAGPVEKPAASAPRPARWTHEQSAKAAPTVIREAAESGLSVLLQSSVRFNAATANRCVTCHQHSLPALTQGLAQEKKFIFDQAVADELSRTTIKTIARRLDSALEEPLPVPSIGAWLLIGLHASAYRADELSDGYAYSLARSQFGDGRWITKAARAPTDYSDVTTTALAIRALRHYAPPTMTRHFEGRIDRAATWLRSVRADSTEERALQILGLHWAQSDRSHLRDLAADLLLQQRDGGGWSQLPTLKSDAYATGLALYALHEGDGLRPSDPAYQRGIRFLLKEQHRDGSWFVESRASPVQVAIDDIFPHGKDQWISSSATSWSTLALMLASPPASVTAVSP